MENDIVVGDTVTMYGGDESFILKALFVSDDGMERAVLENEDRISFSFYENLRKKEDTETEVVCQMVADIEYRVQDSAYDICKALYRAGYTK